MDAERLSVLQDSGARVKVGRVTGLIDGFKLSAAGGVIHLRDAGEVRHEDLPLADVVEVDPVDEARVAQVRQARADENARILAERVRQRGGLR